MIKESNHDNNHEEDIITYAELSEQLSELSGEEMEIIVGGDVSAGGEVTTSQTLATAVATTVAQAASRTNAISAGQEGDFSQQIAFSINSAISTLVSQKSQTAPAPGHINSQVTLDIK
jgi:hypothetical protein